MNKTMKLCELSDGDTLHRYKKSLVVCFHGKRKVLSTGPNNGGLRYDLQAVFNYDGNPGSGMQASMRADTYEEHMRTCVDGANEYYEKTAAHFPERGAIHILDLGCGTGLELDALWKRNPEIEVTGVDLAGDMLAVLRKKHPDKKLHLIQASYFDVDFGQGQFDAAVSVQTMHHFTHEEKISLYRRLCTCLKPGGWYVETDYMAPDSRYEEQCFADYERVKQEQGLGEGFYHFDRPCTVIHQLSMLRTAGFMDAQECCRCGGTIILLARR